MDFFREQDVARRNTRLLVLLFIVAVLVLITLTNLLVAGALFYGESAQAPGGAVEFNGWTTLFDWQRFLLIGAGIAGVIGAVVLVNWLRFAQGGRTVAEALGGRPAATNTDDPLERRALNIVAEMSLAANMPVPPLYILDDERGINAFAAGINPSDAVVAITRGAMVQLNRDELQGVIGHEFSHILNGDMRLSIRLAAMLRGITFIGDVGSVLLDASSTRRLVSSSRSKNDSRAAGLAMGLGLYLIGFLGGLMAGMIKSAISKQKEYLADASSVQFTRNPDGIGNALKVIGGYTPGTLVHSARAEELSHLFFGQVKHRLWLAFATHPPLPDRIRRIDPHWDGHYIAREPDHAQLEPGRFAEAGQDRARRVMAAAGAATLAAVDLATQSPAINDGADGAQQTAASAPALAVGIIEQSREPLSAMALVLALHWHEGPGKNKQLDALTEADITGLEGLVAQFGAELDGLPNTLRLPLLELCLPTLKQISAEQYERFKKLLLQFVKADGQIGIGEWCLYQLVRHYLDPQFVQTRLSRPRHAKLDAVSTALATVLGTLALHGDQETDAAFQRGATVLGLPLSTPAVDQLGVADFSKAVGVLADCYPLLKVTILKAMATTAAHDGVVNPEELTLIKAIAAVIDCPVPEHMLPAADR